MRIEAFGCWGAIALTRSPPCPLSLSCGRAAEDSARRLSSGGDELRARAGALEQEAADLRKARDSLMGQLRCVAPLPATPFSVHVAGPVSSCWRHLTPPPYPHCPRSATASMSRMEHEMRESAARAEAEAAARAKAEATAKCERPFLSLSLPR